MTAEREGLVEEVASAAFEALPCSPRCYRATRGHHSGSCVLRRMSAAEKVADTLADLLAARDRRVRGEAVETVARMSERLRRENPMNGDGANHMLDRVQRIMAAESPGATLAIEAERKVIWAEREADYARLEAENERRREAAE